MTNDIHGSGTSDLAIQSETRFNVSLLRIELGKMLGLVAPITMTADQCAIWIASAEDTLQGIRADEVSTVSLEVRRSVTRHNQIVPKISELVAANRAHRSRMRAFDTPAITELPIRRHISDRNRAEFKADDWAELNAWLETQGTSVRYRSDGTKYFAENPTAPTP